MHRTSYLALALIATAIPLRAQTIASSQPVRRATAVAAGNPAAPDANGQGSGQAPTPLHNGDTLEIRIANVPGDDQQQWDSLTYTIDESGMVNLPIIGLVKVAGMLPSQAQNAVQTKLVSDGIYTNPTIAITLPAAALRFISAGKGLRSPGRIQYTPDLTLMSAIDAAGGPDDFAGDDIHLIRAGKMIHYSKKKLTKDPSLDPPVQAGDRIEIKENPW